MLDNSISNKPFNIIEDKIIDENKLVIEETDNQSTWCMLLIDCFTCISKCIFICGR
jgi:hypothetical protein